MDLAPVYNRCTQLVDQLTLPRPFNLVDFVTGIARRPVFLLPVDTTVEGPCGMLVRTSHADYICFERGTSRVHRDHIVLHEAAHLLMGHTQTNQLLPDLDLDVLGRSRYSDIQEQEAEIAASLLAARIGVRTRPSGDSILGRVEASLAG